MSSTFTKKVFVLLATKYPFHRFILFVDNPVTTELQLPANITTELLTPKPKNYLTYNWWFNVKLPFALRKNKVEVFVGANGAISSFSSIPQVLLLHNLLFLHKFSAHPKHSYLFYKSSTAGFIKKANAIGAISAFIASEVEGKYATDLSAIKVFSSSVSSRYKPIEWQVKEQVKEQYTDGYEYFIFNESGNATSQFINTLKAFSIFKKWQRSSMKLLVVDNKGSIDTGSEKFQTYKYRNEVVVVRGISKDEEAKIVASAYALVFPSMYEGFAVPVLQAIKSGVPVITSPKSSMEEIAGEAALYATPGVPDELAEQMKRIFKDEQLRTKLVEAGRQVSDKYSWEKTAEVVWQLILEAANK